MRAVRLNHVGAAEWDALNDGERDIWGPGEALAWRDKTRHVGVLGANGLPLALAGAVAADVAAGGERFEVVGIGSVIVTRRMRGQGLAGLVIEAILDLAVALGPERAMLFCNAPLTVLYERFGFRLIDAPVTAEQPDGRVTMSMRAMWAPLAEGAAWPPGEVEVLGLPF